MLPFSGVRLGFSFSGSGSLIKMGPEEFHDRSGSIAIAQ